ncbi:MAG: hypothetical protein BGO43_12535 [Gammaproteobacteria bacterium 39-13]|nr:hypothetical protein [Gammaproteobacteria bacterium]OJV89975.1 MAG: hypothetical protein BGO43_12535 [Gammaproteobacteria bacterium 39-13]
MKYLLVTLLALAVAAGVGLSLHHDPGMLILTVAGWRIDMPLWLAVLILVVAYLIVHYALQLIRGIFHGTSLLASFSTSWRKRRAKKLTNKGLVALAEGNWALAEKELLHGAENSFLPWLNYLSAAKAAQELGKDDKRDEYLRQAQKSMPETEVAVLLTQAELQYRHHQYQQSLATLNRIQQKSPNHPCTLKLLQQVYCQLQEWEKLQVLLPKLKQYHVLNASTFKTLEQIMYRELLVQKSDSLETLEAFWETIPKDQRLKGDIAYFYAKALIKKDKSTEAELVLRSALKHEWQEKLIRLYGHLSHPAPQKLLNMTETWINQHPESPGLLLTLGRLCEQQQLWGKAQRYLEASLSLEPHPETYAQLGSLLEKMNKPEVGAQYYKKGLLLATPLISNQTVRTYTEDEL